MSIDDFGSVDQLDSEENEKSLLDYGKFIFNIIWEYKILVIVITSLGAILSVAFSIATLKLSEDVNPMPNTYLAYTRVLIQEGSSSGNDNFALMMDMLGMSSSGNQGMSKGALAQMVYHSFPYADSILERFGLMDRYSQMQNPKTAARRKFYNDSSFSYDVRSGQLTISYISTDKYLATDIVVYMLEELQLWFFEQGGAVSESQLDNIESKIFEVSAEIKILEEKIKSMQLEYGVLSISDLALAQQNLVTSLNEQLMNLDLQISQQENTQSSYSPVEQGSVRELRGQRKDVANTLERLEAGLPVGNKVYPPADELPNIALEFQQLQLLYEIQSGIYRSLTEQYEMLKLSSGGSLSFTILEPAEVPEEKYGPIRSQICINVTLFSFAISIILAFGMYFIKRIKVLKFMVSRR